MSKKSISRALALWLLAGVAHQPLLAQEPAPAPEPETAVPAADEAPVDAELDPDAEDGEEIVVTGQRPFGSVIGDIEPEVTFNRGDIRSFGAGSLSELLDAIAPQTSSGRGRGGERPVVLLNGKRISGFQEIRGIPPEAIVRMEVLP